jgi:hypothetical protein
MISVEKIVPVARERLVTVRDDCGATIRMGSRIASGRNVPERLFVASS